MSNPSAEDELDPAAAHIVAKVRWLMLISAATTGLAIAAVIGVIGYRVFRAEGSTPAEVTALLPKGARVVSTALGEDRIVVTLDVGGAIEIRTFDAKTLKPMGRLKFATEPPLWGGVGGGGPSADHHTTPTPALRADPPHKGEGRDRVRRSR